MRARLVLGAALALAVTACGKDGDQAPALPEEVARVDGLRAMPAEVSAVIGVDVGALVDSKLVRRAAEQLFLRDAGLAERARGLVDACKLDLEKDVEEIVIGLLPPEGEAGSESVLIATGRFSESELTACLGRHLGARGGELHSKGAAGRTIYEAAEAGGDGVWLGFGSAETAVVASSEEALVSALGKGPKLAGQADMVALIARAGTDAALWAAGRVDPQVGEGLVAGTGGQVAAPKALFGHVGLDGGLELFLAAEMASGEDAKKLISVAKAQLEAGALVAQRHGLGPLVQRIEARADERTAALSLTLSEAELAKLLAAIDKDTRSNENPGPESGLQGDPDDGQGDAPSGGEAPAR